MRKICIFNRKGGVGKSTTSVNLSSYLAILKAKVLVIDLDAQGDSTESLGIDEENIIGGICQIILGTKTLEECIMHSCAEGVDVIPANDFLGDDELEINSDMRNVLKGIIKKSDLAKKYDYVIFDCPPGVSELTYNALACSDSVIAPVMCSYYAVKALPLLIAFMDKIKKELNNDLYIEGIVMTMYEESTNLAKEMYQLAGTYFGDKLFKTYIPKNVELAKAGSYNVPISQFNPSCKGAKGYYNLAKELHKKYK